jgi:hypothetical protein
MFQILTREQGHAKGDVEHDGKLQADAQLGVNAERIDLELWPPLQS